MVEKTMIDVNGKKVTMTKVTHEDLPSYAWMKGVPICNGFVGDIPQIKEVSSKYAKVEIDSSYYEEISVAKKID